MATESTSMSESEREGTIANIQGQAEIEAERGDCRNAVSIEIIKEKLENLPQSLFEKSYIFRVDQNLRESNEKAYEPILVSIGPYHRGKNSLQYMELHKLKYLQRVIQRNLDRGAGTSKDDLIRKYLVELRNLEVRARQHYAEVITLDQDEFLNMMLLDGCFILELFRSNFDPQDEYGQRIYGSRTRPILWHDLMLADNQLPFFVLEKLHDITMGDFMVEPCIYALAYVSSYFFMLPTAQAFQEHIDLLLAILNRETESARDILEQLNDVKHFLDLVYRFMFIVDKTTGPRRIKSEATHAKRETSDAVLQMAHRYSATDLRHSGVRFRGVESKRFYEITFKNGILEIPKVQISELTEVIFRNMIAYEKYGFSWGDRSYVSDYVVFMDNLINSAKDVELLRLDGIIEHYLGDDEAVSTMFNEMGKRTTWSTNYYYAIITNDLNDHCKKRRNMWSAKLRRDYFNSPWAIISVIAAFVLLALATVQTIYSTLSYYKAK